VRVQELVTAANVNERDESGETLLHYAYEGGQRWPKIWIDRQTPLIWAAMHAHPSCAKLLLDARCERRDCLQLWAHSIAFCLLVGRMRSTSHQCSSDPAGVNAVNKYGCTPLHRAAEYGMEVCLFLDAGSAVDTMGDDGRNFIGHFARANAMLLSF
jgi:ankyrin repeat protein